MLDICPADTGQFWDPSKTWSTESPRLSRCFRQTGLVWAPCLVAVLHVALALPGLLHPERRRKLIWTLSGVCRPLFGTLALAVKLGQVVWEASSEESLRWGALSAGGLLCLSLAAVVGLLLGELSLGQSVKLGQVVWEASSEESLRWGALSAGGLLCLSLAAVVGLLLGELSLGQSVRLGQVVWEASSEESLRWGALSAGGLLCLSLAAVVGLLLGELSLGQSVKLGQVVWEASSEESLRWGALSAGGLLCLSLAAVVGLLLGELSLGQSVRLGQVVWEASSEESLRWGALSAGGLLCLSLAAVVGLLLGELSLGQSVKLGQVVWEASSEESLRWGALSAGGLLCLSLAAVVGLLLGELSLGQSVRLGQVVWEASSEESLRWGALSAGGLLCLSLAAVVGLLLGELSLGQSVRLGQMVWEASSEESLRWGALSAGGLLCLSLAAVVGLLLGELSLGQSVRLCQVVWEASSEESLRWGALSAGGLLCLSLAAVVGLLLGELSLGQSVRLGQVVWEASSEESLRWGALSAGGLLCLSLAAVVGLLLGELSLGQSVRLGQVVWEASSEESLRWGALSAGGLLCLSLTAVVGLLLGELSLGQSVRLGQVVWEASSEESLRWGALSAGGLLCLSLAAVVGLLLGELSLGQSVRLGQVVWEASSEESLRWGALSAGGLLCLSLAAVVGLLLGELSLGQSVRLGQVVWEASSEESLRWGALSAGGLLCLSLAAVVGLLLGELSLGGELSPYLSFFAVLPLLLYSAVEAAAQGLEDTGSPAFALDVGAFVLLCLCFFCLAFRLESEESRAADDVAAPEPFRSGLNRLTLDWLTPLVRLGYKRPLEQADTFRVPPAYEAKAAHETLEANLAREFLPVVTALRTGEAGAKAWMSRCIAKTYGWQLFTSGVLNMSAELMGYMEPLFLKFIINFAKSTDEPTWHGGAYVAGIFSAMLVRNLMTQHYYLILNKMGILMNTGFITAVYRKSLRICPAAKSKFTVGEIVNLMSVDAQRMGDVADILHMCWTCPLQITVAMVFLYYEVGMAAFAGAAVYVAMLPFNGILAHFFDKYQEKQMEEKDNRIKVLTELLNGIKLLKLYAWEPAFLKKLNGIRSAEVGWLRKNALIGGFLDFGWTVSSILAAALTFVTYVALGHTVDAERIFVSFALFDKVNMPLTLLPMAVSYILMLRVSLRRLAAFFAAKELQEGAVEDLPPHDDLALRLHDACFSWGKGSRQTLPGAKAEDNEDADTTTEPEAPTEGEEEPLVLRNISLKAKRGALVAVVGRVGAGKSSLLSALCGELDRVSGSAAVSPALAYVPQSAWIQNMTLRDNVLFGQPFSESRYSKVVKACALEQDLQILQHGDQTEIGERGINLSGGQKARVSLARAVYRSERDLYLLDDPLSALDVHVGKQIFSEVLGPEGLLKDTCRVLVTHALWVLAKCDWVVCLGDGGVVREQGEYGALLGKGGAFAALIRDFLAEAPDEDIVDLDEAALKQLSSSPTIRETLHKRRSRITSQRSEDSHATPKSFSQDAVLEHLSSPVGSPPKRLTSQSPQLLSRESSRVAKSPEPPQETVSDKANLIDEEEVHVGRVSWSVYWSYISQGGVYFVLYFIFQWLAEGCWSSASIWLQIWADGSARPGPNGTTLNATISAETGVAVFSALAAGQAVFSIVLRVCFALGFIRASRRIHDWLTSAIFRAPMAFFDTTPTGRIVNRCGKDLEVVDDQLPSAFDQVLICFIWTVETCVQTVYALPLFAIVMVPILLLFLLILRLYVTTSRQLRRLQSVSRSPVYSTFQETLQGTTSIRAYGAEERFVRHSEALVDENNRAYYCIIASNRWLGFRLSLISSVLATAAASFILSAKVSGGEISPGKAGLGMGNALQFMGILSYFVRQVARLETEIVAVERIREYAQTTAEADWDPPKGSLPPPPNWPPNGGIVFDNYALRYRPGLDLALRGIDCAVEGGSKVGIVGRTGAGKSSLASGLFRLIEAAQGEIRIDGQPIQLLGLHQLRRGLSIIPQDPLVFSGSLRLNLDPHGRLSDGELWAALELAHLKDFAKGLPSGLSHEVAEGGSDLSQGQRQLLCLARALLRKAKVLVLDEATGAVDVETDALVQRTLREAFPTATILTIAHRLNTIMDSDRILVLEQGKVAEWDTPAALLADPHSRFAAMAREAGVALS